MHRRLLHAALALSLISSSGCSMFVRWEPFDYPKNRPWVAPDVRVAAYTKDVPCIMCPTGSNSHLKWVDQQGRRLPHPADIVNDAKSYLSQTEIAQSWPKSWASTFGYGTHAVAPYSFYWVSVNPTIVLMVYSENNDYLANRGKPAAPGRNVSNRFHISTIVPIGSPVLWFSHDLDVPPISVNTDDQAVPVVVFDGGRLLLEEAGGQRNVVRK